jgi:hypothetical protein
MNSYKPALRAEREDRRVTRILLTALALLLGCGAPSLTDPEPRSPTAMSTTRLAIDPARHPRQVFRVDRFVIPDASRAELEAAMARNMAFISTLTGFRGHVVLERRRDATTTELVTIAGWEDRAALERAAVEVRAYYQREGFDMRAALERWGVTMERDDYETAISP